MPGPAQCSSSTTGRRASAERPWCTQGPGCVQPRRQRWQRAQWRRAVRTSSVVTYCQYVAYVADEHPKCPGKVVSILSDCPGQFHLQKYTIPREIGRCIAIPPTTQMSRNGIRTSDNENEVLDSMTADRSIGFEIVMLIINRHFSGIRNLPAAIAICLSSNYLGNIPMF